MSEVAAVTTTDAIASNVASPRAGTKKSSGEGKRNLNLPRTHPPMSEMVTTAIETLKGGRHGSSLQAIKKYIGANYKCDVVKLAPFLRKALRAVSRRAPLSKSRERVLPDHGSETEEEEEGGSAQEKRHRREWTRGKAATVKQKATKHAKTRSPPPKKAASAAKKASSPAAVPKKAAAGGGKKK
ncbi:histone H1-III-like [Armigeres subalbatus]|uniref:histone H1-III-like n=1 Tax=Armigeres subalbatus TaxID=124917 RepID=UPI002ED5CF1F